MEGINITREITLFPHAQFEGLMTIEEMRSVANDIRDEYFRVAKDPSSVDFSFDDVNEMNLNSCRNYLDEANIEYSDDKSVEDIRTLVHTHKLSVHSKNIDKYANDITIYGANSYCSETNGTWNVVMSWQSHKKGRTSVYSHLSTDKPVTWIYTYMIMRDENTNKTYAGPLQNSEYIYDSYFPIARFCKKICFEQFYILDNFMKVNEKAKIIGLFPISNDIVMNIKIKDYKDYIDIISKNNKKLEKLKKDIKFLENHTVRMKEICNNIDIVLQDYEVDIKSYK